MAVIHRSDPLSRIHPEPLDPPDFFDHLPDSILLLVFNRIGDVKALGRCGVVSKRFHSLVPQVENVVVRVDCVISDDDDPSSLSPDKPRSSASPFSAIFRLIFKPLHALTQLLSTKRSSSSSSSPSPSSSLSITGGGEDGEIEQGGVTHHSPTQVLKNFNEIRLLRIELPAGELGIDDGVLLKWRAEFGSTLENCVILGASSVATDPPPSDGDSAAAAVEDNGSIPESFYTNGGLKLRVVWTISSLIAASARHYLLQPIIAEHKTLDSLVLTDTDGQGVLCMNRDQLEELRVKPLSASSASKRTLVPALNMRLWYAPSLELPDGTVLKGATLVAIRPSESKKEVCATTTMAGKQIGGDGVLPANLAGMTKSQLYGIMSQMKALIDQNHEQAREILIQNPLLTKALFQAQIMLGMVQPPQVVPKVELPQQSHQSITPKPTVQAHTSSLQTGVGLQEPAATVQPQAPIRKHTLPMPPPPQQPRFSHPQRLNPAGTSLSHPQSSQVQTAPPSVPHHPTSQPQSFHHLDTPASSTQLQQQQPMHSVGGPQQQPRPYHHQFGPSQAGPNAGFQHHGAPPQHHSQPMFHSGNRLPASGGPQFPQGQPHLVSQPPYQGGGQFRGDYNNNQLGGPTADRGPSWMASQSESSNITHLPGLGPVPPPSQVGPGGGPPPRPAPISAEMEKALLQQVMSLTPEQIILLPPEQRNQVLQLQQILRQ